jgi:diguanylate cyclase (GGDEF)-like protein/PAS domain S-box-containing protein
MSNLLPLLIIMPNLKTKRLLMEQIGNLQSFEIDTVQDSVAAIRLLKAKPYRFIISGTDIGDVDGWSLSSLIRSDIYLSDKKIPIVLVTDTHCERIAEATAKSFGINAVVTADELQQVNHVLADAFSADLPVQTQLSVLTVIDSNELAQSFSNIVGPHFDLHTTTSSRDAISKVQQHTFDLIVIDSSLKDDSALALIKTLKRTNNQLSKVVIVPRHNTAKAEYFITLGASDFIYNPLNPSRVIKVCERASQRNDFIISNAQFAEKVNLLKESEQQYKSLSQAHTKLLENLSSVVIELDRHGNIRFLNSAWQSLTGYSIEHSLDISLMEFIEFDDIGAVNFNQKINDMLSAKVKSTNAEVKILTKKNQPVWVEMKLHQLIKHGKVDGLTATLDNINDRKKAEEELQHLALHDTLTGLYNRYYFDNELNRLTLLASRSKQKHSLLYIDLDHFKIINDTEGHQTGDIVLKEVSQALSSRLRQSDILCRVGGDEFVILLPETKLKNAMEIGDTICQQIAETPFQFGTTTYKISASIGVAEVDGQASAAEYLRQADIALYVAKNKGRNRTHSFAEGDSESTKQLDNLKWVQKVQQAVIDDNLEMHFQPVWSIAEHKVAYFEALVRLSINNELTYPDAFIPALERANDISFLDHQVINKTIKLASENAQLEKVAINLSGQAFSDERLLPLIKEKLALYNVPGERIIFELTESASLTNVRGTRRMIEQLSAIGCQFSIDDFGTGFSTFAYLKELPAHSVKIDGTFVRDMTTNDVDHALVSAIANVALVLNKNSVAEFVENEEVFDSLRKIGVTYAQGYFISKPLPLEQALTFKFNA